MAPPIIAPPAPAAAATTATTPKIRRLVVFTGCLADCA
jgi:hypothetical protein